jgi:hypothetical protein
MVEEQKQKALIVWLIINGKAEEALERLASHYNVDVPRLKVGLPKGHRKETLGCYEAKNKTISVMNSELIKNPLTILHEFYHHIRTGLDTKHKGTENYANRFAAEYIQAYRLASQAQWETINRKD